MEGQGYGYVALASYAWLNRGAVWLFRQTLKIHPTILLHFAQTRKAESSGIRFKGGRRSLVKREQTQGKGYENLDCFLGEFGLFPQGLLTRDSLV